MKNTQLTPKQLRVKQQIVQLEQQLQSLVSCSATLKTQIDTAKTDAKIKHYTKKLKKNNNRVMGCLQTIDLLNKL